jgi:Antirestriction protein (ArdA)
MTNTQNISNYEDILDVRDIIERFEYLEAEEAGDEASPGELFQLEQLSDLLNELRGNGGDEQWRGDWYPVTLIRDSYFNDYAQKLADDICEPNPSDMAWPHNCIDWERAARELQMDYSTVEYDGVTYWYC